MSISNSLFGGVYPSRTQQTQRATSAMSNAIHSAGMANRGPKVPYRSTPKGNIVPTGSAYGKRWGELTRQNKPGQDIWGGKENPGLKYSGGPAQRRDYWHQMAEQPTRVSTPKAPRTPSLKVDKGGTLPGGGWSTQGGFGGMGGGNYLKPMR